MKKSISAFVLAIFTATAIQAQPPMPGAPGRSLPGDNRPPAPPAPMPAPALEPLKEYSGKVVRLVTNDELVYNGFYLLSGSDSLLVHFPAALGSQVMASVKTGSSVAVSGSAHTRPQGGQELRMVSISSNGRVIRDTATALPATPPAETYAEGSGKVSSLQTDPAGHLTGVLVNNKTLLRFGPGAAEQLASLVKNGAEIAFTGRQKPAKQGEVSAGPYTVVRCKTLTVNGQQYLVQ